MDVHAYAQLVYVNPARHRVNPHGGIGRQTGPAALELFGNSQAGLEPRRLRGARRGTRSAKRAVVGASGAHTDSRSTAQRSAVAALAPRGCSREAAFLQRSAHRAVRHPAGAHGAAVGPAARLHCGARPRVVPHHSLRAKPCGLGAALEQMRQVRRGSARVRAPTLGLCSSSPHKSPLPGTARREVGAVAVFDRTPRALLRRRCGAGRDAPVGRRETQRARPRAQRASTSCLAHLSERSAQRVASYAPGRAREHRRAVEKTTAPPKLRGLPRTGFAATNHTHALRTLRFGNAPWRTFPYLRSRIRISRRAARRPAAAPARPRCWRDARCRCSRHGAHRRVPVARPHRRRTAHASPPRPRRPRRARTAQRR